MTPLILIELRGGAVINVACSQAAQFVLIDYDDNPNAHIGEYELQLADFLPALRHLHARQRMPSSSHL